MSETDAILAHPPGSDAAVAAIDALVAKYATQRAEADQAEAAKYETVGAFAVPKPAPPAAPVVEPAPAPVPVPATFAGYNAEVLAAQRAAQEHGIRAAELNSVFALLGNIPGHERVPVDADAAGLAARRAELERRMKFAHPANYRERIAAAERFIEAFGLTKFVDDHRLRDHPEAYDFLGGLWERRNPERWG